MVSTTKDILNKEIIKRAMDDRARLIRGLRRVRSLLNEVEGNYSDQNLVSAFRTIDNALKSVDRRYK